MGVSARVGDALGANGVGTPMLGVDRNGNLSPVAAVEFDPLQDTVSTNETAASASHTATVITLGAVSGLAHAIGGVAFSYSGSASLPSAVAPGRLTIGDGSDTVFDLDVPAAGLDVIAFDPPKQGRGGRAMTITLGDGGAAVVGKLNLLSHYLVTVTAGGLNFDDETNSGLIPLFF